MDDYYDVISTGYEELHVWEQMNKINYIKHFFIPEKDKRLLDVGCGTGLTTYPWPCKRYGLDPARKLIARAKEHDEITYTVAEAEDIPYEDDFFDYVISITAIQNFRDVEKALKEIKRVGKKIFILTFLKRSTKAEMITSLIHRYFKVDKIVEENYDYIFLIGLGEKNNKNKKKDS